MKSLFFRACNFFAGGLALCFGVCSFSVAQDSPVFESRHLDFNELETSFSERMPTNYAGLNWGISDWYYMRNGSTGTNTYLALSSTSTAFFLPGGQDFYCDGADFWSRRAGDANGSFYFYMMRNGQVVYDGRNDKDGRQRFTATPTRFQPNYTGLVDYVAVVFTQGGDDWDHLAMDNLSLRLPVAAVVAVASRLEMILQNGIVQVKLTGAGNQSYTIERSPDLSGTNWVELATVTTDSNGQGSHEDVAPYSVQGFYRAKLEP